MADPEERRMLREQEKATVGQGEHGGRRKEWRSLSIPQRGRRKA